jgi:superfamily II DNA/RNA helicase
LTETTTAPADPTDFAPDETGASHEVAQSAPDPLAAATVEPPSEVAPVVDESNYDYPEEPVEEPVRAVFADLGLSEPVLRAIAEMGYLHPTPIQEEAIPYVLMGRDVLGTAQTGTGKTAGFTLPMLEILSGSRARARMPRSLILEPTRELALQVAENFVMYGKYLKLTHALIIGGESMADQKEVLMRGVDVLIATPGRLIDMFERGGILLTDAKLLVIDEADRMLDMGFMPDVERIVAMLPKNRQTLFFSATMAPEIKRLSDAFLSNPKMISVSRADSMATTITAGLALVAELDKREALRRLIRDHDVQNALIFCNRKVDVDILYKSLRKHNFSVGALHGDMAQSVRFATLEKFKAGELKLLVCSDVAARGIDIGGLSHVFNFDVPHHAEDYIHRSGRTGRAGLAGTAFTIATPTDRLAVEAIEKLTGKPIPRIAVEGLDPVEWAEDDGRRRGRGGARGKPASRGRTEAPARERAETKDAERPVKAAPKRAPKAEADPDAPPKAPRVRAPRAPRVKPAPVATESLAAPETDAAPPVILEREIQPREVQPRDTPARDTQARNAQPRDTQPRERDREQDRGRDQNRDRNGPRREFRKRDDDLGPSVVGFGDDVPSFMLITMPKHPIVTEAQETEMGELKMGETGA